MKNNSVSIKGNGPDNSLSDENGVFFIIEKKLPLNWGIKSKISNGMILSSWLCVKMI